MAAYGPDHRAYSPFEAAVNPSNFQNLVNGWSANSSTGEVIGDRNTVFLSNANGVRALNHDTGIERWHAAYPISTVPALAGDRLLLATTGSHCEMVSVRALDNTDPVAVRVGGPDLSNTLPGAISGCTIKSDVVIDGDAAIVSWSWIGQTPTPGCPQGANLAWTGFSIVGTDGTLRVQVTDQRSVCGSPPPGVTPPDPFGTVTRSSHHYLTTHGGAIEAYPVQCPEPCRPTWAVTPPAAPIGTVLSLPGNRIAVHAGGALVVLDESTGITQWSMTSLVTSRVAANDTFIFVVNTELLAFPIGGCGAATCGPTWRAPIQDVLGAGRPSITGNLLLVPTVNSGVVFDARGCGALQCSAIDVGRVTSYVTPSNIIAGRLFVPVPGRLVTFALPAG